MKKAISIPNYTMKLRAYPNKEQREKIDNILHGLRVAYNCTLYEMSQKNPAVTRTSVDKNDPTKTVTWPDFRKAAKKEWLDQLREKYPVVASAPVASLSSNGGIFLKDGKKSWEKHGKIPVEGFGKKFPRYYSNKYPRTSFLVQSACSAFKQTDNNNVVKIRVNGVGIIKCRGWNTKILFGGNGEPFFDWAKDNSKKMITVQVDKDTQGYYWVCLSFQNVQKVVECNDNKHPIGIDVGIKDIAITSDGVKYQNNRYKRNEKDHLAELNRRLSRRYGWSNIKFREDRKKDTNIVPSKSYEKTRIKLAKLNNDIANKRSNYNHKITTDIVKNASYIGVETLNVKGMMRNKHLAYSLSDAAMSQVLTNLQYKSDWYGVDIEHIDRWTPSSKRCSSCGYIMPNMPLNIREWQCPECGTKHDRDINAAKNILWYAQNK